MLNHRSGIVGLLGLTTGALHSRYMDATYQLFTMGLLVNRNTLLDGYGLVLLQSYALPAL